jgi:PadR family transcriptional regulator, regulatory protein PadR
MSHGISMLDTAPTFFSPHRLRGTMAPRPLTLMPGTLDLLVLRTLVSGPMHGYGIATLIHQRTEGDLAVEDAALYQALHRLDRQDLVEAEWRQSENNRRAKFYSLTAAGRKQLAREAKEWHATADLIAAFLAPKREAR